MKNKKLLGILGITALLLAGNFAWQNAKEVDAAESSRMIFLDPTDKASAGAWFAARCWNDNGEYWYKMTDVDNDGKYEAHIDTTTYPNVIFCRMNSADTSKMEWSNVWNQSADLTFQADKNTWTWAEGQWTGNTGSWSSFTPKYHLYGTVNDWSAKNEYKFTNHSSAYEVKLEDVYLEKGDEFKIVKNEETWLANVNPDCKSIIKQDNAGQNIGITVSGTYDFYWNFSTNQLWIVLDAPSAIKDVFTAYYNSGAYTKHTIINLQEEKAKGDLATHFHAGVSKLERTTYYNGDALWMENGSGYSYYGTDGGNMTSGKVDEVGKTSPSIAVRGKTMEQYYATLHDFMVGTHNSVHSNNTDLDLTAGWTYANGVFYSSHADVIDAARLFTAPLWIGKTDTNENFVNFTHVSVQETENGLVMKLWCASGNSGLLVSNVENDKSSPTDTEYSLVFSQATITK